MENYKKVREALRYWLLGAELFNASRAMEFAERYHRGTRKDNITPEFAHQVAIVSYLRTLLPHLRYPEETLSAAFLHDVREDYDLGDREIREPFGDIVADAVDGVTKTFRGDRRDDELLFERMAECPIRSILKPADRIHNLNSMVGVFTVERMRSYADETRTLFLPMIKKARRNFPDQEPAYENVKLVLMSQLQFIDALTCSTD